MTLELVRAEWLLLLWLLPLWWWWVRPRRTWGMTLASTREAEPLALHRWLGAPVEAMPRFLRSAAVACVVVALAGPRLVHTYQEPVTEGVGIALAVDLSTSMWAEDMADRATRLDVAKETLQRFLDMRDDDVGLVSFAGEALTRLPLTHDRYVTRAAVDALEVGLLLDGTDVAGAIAAAAALLRDAPHAAKILILVTDGAHNRSGLLPTLAARAAAAHGVRIYPVAIGTEESAGVGATDMETVLTQAALITGGRYFRATDVNALDAIYAEIDRLTEPSEQLVDRLEITPVGAFPLLLAVLLTVLGVGLRGSRWGVIP